MKKVLEIVAFSFTLRLLAFKATTERLIIHRMSNQTGDVFESKKASCIFDFCSKMKASNISKDNNCKCRCRASPNPTFDFKDGAWRCVDDRLFRMKEGKHTVSLNNQT